MRTKGSKRRGNQECDNCGRDFIASESEWNCPHCGFDNRVGVERCQHGARVAAKKSADLRKKKAVR